MIYKAGQIWGSDGADAVVGGLLAGLTEFSAIGHDGGSPSDPNYRVGVMRSTLTVITLHHLENADLMEGTAEAVL